MKTTIRKSTMGNDKDDDTNDTDNDTKIIAYHVSKVWRLKACQL